MQAHPAQRQSFLPAPLPSSCSILSSPSTSPSSSPSPLRRTSSSPSLSQSLFPDLCALPTTTTTSSFSSSSFSSSFRKPGKHDNKINVEKRKRTRPSAPRVLPRTLSSPLVSNEPPLYYSDLEENWHWGTEIKGTIKQFTSCNITNYQSVSCKFNSDSMGRELNISTVLNAKQKGVEKWLTFRIGDDVYLRSLGCPHEDPSCPGRKVAPDIERGYSHVARIKALYEVRKTRAKCVAVQWYWRPEETAEGRLSSNGTDELFLPRGQRCSEHSVTQIQNKAKVMGFSAYNRHHALMKRQTVTMKQASTRGLKDLKKAYLVPYFQSNIGRTFYRSNTNTKPVNNWATITQIPKPKPNHVEEEDTRCLHCGEPEPSEDMLLCDGCNNGYHIFCLIPKLTKIPDDDWFCDMCIAKENKKKRRKE